jgi:hypothetical protein
MNKWQMKHKCLEKTCPSATLSTTNPIRLDPGLNPSHHCGKLTTGHLSYGTANTIYNIYILLKPAMYLHFTVSLSMKITDINGHRDQLS